MWKYPFNRYPFTLYHEMWRGIVWLYRKAKEKYEQYRKGNSQRTGDDSEGIG